VFCLMAGMVALLYGVWAMHLYSKYTPLYTDIVCRMGQVKLKNVQLGTPMLSPTTFELLLENRCHNQNAYTIGFADSEKGKVFYGNDMLEVGSVLTAPYGNSSLPATGTGSVWALAEVRISGQMLLSGLTHASDKGGVPLYLELNNLMDINLQFFFGGWSIRKWMRKKCGLRLANLGSALLSMSDPTGPLGCDNDWASLVVPDLQDTGSLDMVLSGDNMDPEELKKGKLAKDIGLGLQIALGLGGGILLIARGLRELCHLRPASKEQYLYDHISQRSE